jgi:hypothetical protein
MQWQGIIPEDIEYVEDDRKKDLLEDLECMGVEEHCKLARI